MGIDFRGILMRRLPWRLNELFFIMLSAKQKAKTLQSINQEIMERKSAYESTFCEAVGRALSFWARLEELLVVITGILLGTQFTNAGIIMYEAYCVVPGSAICGVRP
jgi:hypothetical protein